MINNIGQLKATCNYIFKEKQELDATLFNKKYLVVSTPGVEPLDPFDASYFDQEYMLTVKEETGALVRAVNEVYIQTPGLIISNGWRLAGRTIKSITFEQSI